MESIKKIKKEIFKYYQMIFENEEEDYLFNKQLKEKIRDIIISSKNKLDKQEEALRVLAQATGCAEDLEIAEKILEDLEEDAHITKEQVDFFYENVGTNRWT